MHKNSIKKLRTWVEIDSRAARRNYDIFRKIVGPRARLWSVVKSNAYGHGLFVFSKLMDRIGVDGFCVDSLIEGVKLRQNGIKKHILVLGPTLPELFEEAAQKKITLSISNFDALEALVQAKNIPDFHLKLDTGMHRQGFYFRELAGAIRELKVKGEKFKAHLTGIFTHFASAKDINYPTYTEFQFQEFEKAARLFEKAGFHNLTKHAAATGATLINPKYHLDAVRVGIGLYGLWPSKELEIQLGQKIMLSPVLSWRTMVSEVKDLGAGDYVGYDLAERSAVKSKEAIIPIGYWHGFPRSLSGTGEVLIRGRRAKVLGRVSMDLTAVEVKNIGVKSGDIATIIGNDKSGEIRASETAEKAGTTHYELLTRLNPLIERIVE